MSERQVDCTFGKFDFFFDDTPITPHQWSMNDMRPVSTYFSNFGSTILVTVSEGLVITFQPIY